MLYFLKTYVSRPLVHYLHLNENKRIRQILGHKTSTCVTPVVAFKVTWVLMSQGHCLASRKCPKSISRRRTTELDKRAFVINRVHHRCLDRHSGVAPTFKCWYISIWIPLAWRT